MVERKFINREANLSYQSTVVGKNNDDTYEVRHIFVDEDGREYLIKYPRVKITIDSGIDAFEQFNRLFPYGSCQVLPFGESKELFTLTIKE